jgi:hypothetical protein
LDCCEKREKRVDENSCIKPTIQIAIPIRLSQKDCAFFHDQL